MSQTMEHYTAYRPRPFTVDERKDVTLLFGGLTWKHERLMQGALENMGYHAMPLPNVAREDLDAGKELIDTGACCPTIFTTGNLARFLKDRSRAEGAEVVLKKYVFITAGSCGPCRFGQYHESYTMALDGLGLRDFRMFLLDQTPTDQGQARGGGLDVNLPFSLGTVWAILCGDLLTDLEYRTRPYEVVPGATDRALKECVDLLYDAFRHRPHRGEKAGTVAWHLLTDHFTKALRKAFLKWDAIEVDRLRVKPRVKITGEFWLQTHEGDGNYDIKRWLEREGAEVIPPPVAVWIDYLNALEVTKLTDRVAAGDVKARRKLRVLKLAGRVFRWNYDRLRRALGGVPGALPDQDELKRLAAPYYSYRMDGGEGHMLVGKALYAHLHKQAHMTCELSPYSCMPNTMSIGAMSNVLGQHPDLLYAPIEVKGDAEVHALSRAQMVLTEAKKRAAREFEDVLAGAALTLEDARRLAAADGRLSRAGYALPHHGVAGTAANAVLDLVARRH
jgi:predicted nucleotide-binding protein (sugar kinase/HSP70/actin superfamily)